MSKVLKFKQPRRRSNDEDGRGFIHHSEFRDGPIAIGKFWHIPGINLFPYDGAGIVASECQFDGVLNTFVAALIDEAATGHDLDLGDAWALFKRVAWVGMREPPTAIMAASSLRKPQIRLGISDEILHVPLTIPSSLPRIASHNEPCLHIWPPG